jgi:hypothetical protein
MFRKSGIKMFTASILLIFCNIKFKIFKKLFKGCGSNLFGQKKEKAKSKKEVTHYAPFTT